MDPLQLTLPPEAREYIDAQIATGQFQSPSEVVVDALAAARELQAHKRLAALIREGLESGPPIPVNEEWWAKRRAEILAKYQQEAAQ